MLIICGRRQPSVTFKHNGSNDVACCQSDRVVVLAFFSRCSAGLISAAQCNSRLRNQLSHLIRVSLSRFCFSVRRETVARSGRKLTFQEARAGHPRPSERDPRPAEPPARLMPAIPDVALGLVLSLACDHILCRAARRNGNASYTHTYHGTPPQTRES